MDPAGWRHSCRRCNNLEFWMMKNYLNLTRTDRPSLLGIVSHNLGILMHTCTSSYICLSSCTVLLVSQDITILVILKSFDMNLLFPYIRKWNPFSYFIRIYIASIIFNAATLLWFISFRIFKLNWLLCKRDVKTRVSNALSWGFKLCTFIRLMKYIMAVNAWSIELLFTHLLNRCEIFYLLTDVIFFSVLIHTHCYTNEWTQYANSIHNTSIRFKTDRPVSTSQGVSNNIWYL